MSYIYSLYISLSKKSKPSTKKKKSQNLTCKLPKIKHIKTYNGYLSFSFPNKKTYDGNGNECFNRAFSLLRISLSEN